ncbi:hypothetical protein LARV_03479 [Longilinea arvoryzae]|uniref:Uncharacterized protein n=1 Tax=Longilinea arvoryzae TaxID=360412 RepID=A0A0S7BD14_9CHLR|nr:hypothetical protein [Longilinea arvoryzae]GAP15687.1 hypothetical protein LARV_03479 [Longilinea arvoryzae]
MISYLHKIYRTAVILSLALGIVSCQGASQATAVSPSQTGTTFQRPTGVATGDMDLANPGQGLETLQSYRQKLEVTLTGSKQGSAYETSQSIDRSVLGADESVQVNQAGPDGAALQFAEAYLSGYHYSQDDAGAACRAEANSEDEIPSADPASRLPAAYGLKRVGQETVNGLNATHYTFDERSLVDSEGVLKKAAGEVWWAEEINAVVKYQLSAEIASSGFTGTRSWTYELDQVNQVQSLALPAACQPVLADLPVPSGATDLLTQPGFLRYTAAVTRAQAVAFYAEQLPALGWQSLPGSTPETADLTSAVTVLSYSRDDPAGGRILVLRLEDGSGKLQVIAQTVLTKQPIRLETSTQTVNPSNENPQPTESAVVEAQLPADLPSYPNATVLMQNENILALETQDSTSDVIDFYLRELNKTGWQKDQQIENAGLTMLTFVREEETLLINLISSNTGATQITITAMPG